MKNITMLDCTLRDGTYITNSDFGDTAIRGIIGKMEEAGIEIIECGWLKDKERSKGSTFFHKPEDLAPYIINKNPKISYVVMIDWDRYNIDQLPDNDGKTIDAIRVVFPYEHYKEGISVGKMIKEKGYKVYLQAANTLAYSDGELDKLADEVNILSPVALSIVDTFGAMYPEDLERIMRVLNNKLESDIQLGWHSHNNQQLSFALSMEFAKQINILGRKGIIDASLCGMGRGAGNATTELVASYLNKKHGTHYDLDAIMDAIDTYMMTYKEKYEWGYSTPYFIAGLYGCHVNNIAYLLNNHRTNAKDMRNIIESLPVEYRKKYDYDILEEQYLKNESFHVDDTEVWESLRREICDKKVLLVAPGKSSLTEKEKINKVIDENDIIVIGVNAILPKYKYDYLFFVNPARYEYAEKANYDVFTNTKHILLSNIKNVAGEGEQILGFNKVVKRGWKYYDNAVICALRMLEKLNPDEVMIAGFDGFKTKYNESYADTSLPAINPDNNWDTLNNEIMEMFAEYKNSYEIGNRIVFVTESIFAKGENNKNG